MSKYEWKKENVSFTIGWDRPMRTFFLQVHDESINEFEGDEDVESCVLWLGGDFDEFPQLKPLVEKFSVEYPNEDIPDVLKLHLEADRKGYALDAKNTLLPPFIKKIC